MFQKKTKAETLEAVELYNQRQTKLNFDYNSETLFVTSYNNEVGFLWLPTHNNKSLMLDKKEMLDNRARDTVAQTWKGPLAVMVAP